MDGFLKAAEGALNAFDHFVLNPLMQPDTTHWVTAMTVFIDGGRNKKWKDILQVHQHLDSALEKKIDEADSAVEALLQGGSATYSLLEHPHHQWLRSSRAGEQGG